MELAGTVIARGANATLWAEGAAVMGIVGGGAMARRITLHERELAPVPAGVSLVDAAAIPEAFWTAWDAMRQARLGVGDHVVIHAATSGVGTAAIQVARALGARPIATGRSAEKLAKLGPLVGLDPADAIVVENGRFAAAVSERTGGRGADVVIDLVGAAYLEENVRAIAPRGRIVMLSTSAGATGPAPIGMLMGKRGTVIGTVLRSRALEEKIELAREIAARVVPLFARGALRPVVDRVLPMHECAAAHAHMEADANVGKIVLRW
jgi:NADPH:quinone reductase-like Zn-dependent oxidoreductase